MKQWELENNSKVELPDGSFATFLKMDGMYAHWEQNGEIKIGNYDELEKTSFGYRVKKENKKLAQVGVLCHLLGCEPDELQKHSTTVYQWRNLMYEVTGSKSKTAPPSHYVTVRWGGKLWSVRELGSQSAIVQKMKGKR